MKRSLSMALALLCLLLCMPSPAARTEALPFSDVSADAWYFNAITALADLGAVDGYPDGTFRPLGTVSRVEFYKLALTTLGGQWDAADWEGPWYQPYLQQALELGIIPQDLDYLAPITREEVADFIWQLSGGGPIPTRYRRLGETVADFDAIASESQGAVLALYEAGILIGDSRGHFNPAGTLTRAEAATVQHRLTFPLTCFPTPIPALPVDTLKAAQASQQIITVTTDRLSDTAARVNVYEEVDGVWLRLHRDLPAVCGTRGLMYDRKQNSMKTPAGKFGFVFAFGAQSNPGVRQGMEYREITPDSYWVLDSSSPLYNRWTEGRGNYDDREHLQSFGSQYDYALVIDFNYHSPVKGDGGAIFMHMATDDGKGTAGCIGLSREAMVALLQWVDPEKNPRIIICPEGDLNNY